MAKDKDPLESEWDAPPLPLDRPKLPTRPSGLGRLGLRHLMISLLYFAALFWALKQILDTNAVVAQVPLSGC